MQHRSRIALATLCAMLCSALLAAPDSVDPASLSARTKRAETQLRASLGQTLREAVLELQVNNSTSLRELAAGEPEIAKALEAHLAGLEKTIPITADPNAPRLTTKLKVDIAALADVLKPVSAKHQKGTRVSNADFDTMPALNEAVSLPVSAAAWIPSKFADQPAYKIDPQTGKADYRLPALWMTHLQPRLVKPARALTRLAARRDGIERLAVKLAHTPIHTGPLAGKALTPAMLFGEKDNAHNILKSFIRNTAIGGIRYHRDVMVCEVEVLTSLKNAITNLKSWVAIHGTDAAKEHIPTLVKFVQNTKIETLRATGIAAVAPRYAVADYDTVQTAMVNLVAATPRWAFTTKTATDATIASARAELTKTIRELPMLGSDNGTKTLGDFLTAHAANAPDLNTDFDELIAAFPCEMDPNTGRDIYNASANLKDVWNLVLHYAPQIAEAKAKAKAEDAAAKAAADAKAKVEASKPDAITPDPAPKPGETEKPKPLVKPEAKVEVKPVPKVEIKPDPKVEVKPEPAPEQPAPDTTPEKPPVELPAVPVE